jgi:hypothetical protein
MIEPTIKEQIKTNRNQIAYAVRIIDRLFSNYNKENDKLVNVFLEEITINMSSLVRILQKYQKDCKET